jgi:hypothetical protein
MPEMHLTRPGWSSDKLLHSVLEAMRIGEHADLPRRYGMLLATRPPDAVEAGSSAGVIAQPAIRPSGTGDAAAAPAARAWEVRRLPPGRSR